MVEKPVRPIPEVSFFFGASGSQIGSSSNSGIGYEEPGVEAKSKPLSMSRSATEHAKRVGLERSEIYEVVNFPEKVEPDRSNPGRSRYHRGSLTVVVSDDGCILAIFDKREARR